MLPCNCSKSYFDAIPFPLFADTQMFPLALGAPAGSIQMF